MREKRENACALLPDQAPNPVRCESKRCQDRDKHLRIGEDLLNERHRRPMGTSTDIDLDGRRDVETASLVDTIGDSITHALDPIAHSIDPRVHTLDGFVQSSHSPTLAPVGIVIAQESVEQFLPNFNFEVGARIGHERFDHQVTKISHC